MHITKEQASTAATQWFNNTFNDELLLCLVRSGLIEPTANEFRSTCISQLKKAIQNADIHIEQFQPDWDTINGDWLAMDANGTWTSFAFKPYCVNGVWGYYVKGKYYAEPQIKYAHPDYKKSLQQRP